MPRSLDASATSVRRIALLTAVLAAVVPALAQITPNPAPGASRPSLSGDPRDNDPFRENTVLRDRMERGRAADRQRRIVDDANRLVALTAQYRKSLEGHATPNQDDQKLLMQIEKLARDVKDRMRGM